MQPSVNTRICSSKLVGLIAISWSLLVWLNWFNVNPFSFEHFTSALLTYGQIKPFQALQAAGPHCILLVQLGLLIAATYGIGRPLVQFMRATNLTCSGILTPALGAGILGLGTLGIGFNGLAFPSLVWIVVLPAAGFGVFALRKWPRARLLPAQTWPCTAVIGIALLLSIIGALAPEASYDGQVHHLAHPQLYAASHKIYAQPHHFLSNYPALLEMQYLFSMLLSGTPQLAKLVHYSWGLLTVFALLAWTRERMENPWALATAAGFVLLPYVQLVSMWAYVDLGAAGYLTLAIWVATTRRLNFAVLGVLCALCASTKVTGIFAIALVMVILLANRSSVRSWLILAFSFVLVIACWGLKNLAFTGNPFAPFMSDIFPTLWWGSENSARYMQELASYQTRPAHVQGWLEGFARPWIISIYNLGVLDNMGGISGWFLWGFPLLLVLGIPEARKPALLVLGYFALWHLIPRQVRYLLPIWPVAALVCAYVVRALAQRKGLAAISAWGMGAVLVIHLGLAVNRQHMTVNPIAVVFGNETTEQYLARGIPGHMDSVLAKGWLNSHQGSTRTLLLNHYGLGLFWGAHTIRQSFFDMPLFERYAKESRTAEDIHKRFKQAGIGLTMYSQNEGFKMQVIYRMFQFDPDSSERWKTFWNSEARLQHAQAQQYLFYRIGPYLDLEPPRGRNSVWPGLDDQWMADLHEELRTVEGRPEALQQLAKITEQYQEIARTKGSPTAYERTGLLRLQLGEESRARAALVEAVRRGRHTKKLEVGLGVLDARAGEMKNAAGRFRAALQIDPGYEEARANLARVYWALGKRSAALKELTKGLELNPTSTRLQALWNNLTSQKSRTNE